MTDETDKQKIKDGVQEVFIERNRNTIAEKISDCIEAGLTQDEANHTVIQAVKNLSNHLLLLKIIAREQEDEDVSNGNIKSFAHL